MIRAIPNIDATCKKVNFPRRPRLHSERALERLYLRKATLEALIESLEDYLRCRTPAEVTPLPSRRN